MKTVPTNYRVLSNGEISNYIREDLVIDRLTLEVYGDFLKQMQRQLNQISNMTPYVLWGERHDNIQIEIQTLNTILS